MVKERPGAERGSVANPELLLKPGMTASMRIETQRHNKVLRVPDTALRYVPTESADRGTAAAAKPATTAGHETARTGHPAQVWVLREGRPQRVPVVIGLDDDAFAEVLEGDLHEGDAVIVSERSATTPRGDSAQGGPRLPRL